MMMMMIIIIPRSDMCSEIMAWRFLIKVFRSREMSNGLLSSEYCIFGI